MKIQWFLIFLWLGSPMSIAAEQFCLHNTDAVQTLILKNIGTKKALTDISTMIENGKINAFDMNDSADRYFFETQWTPKGCMILKRDEALDIEVNTKKGPWIPFVDIDPDTYQAHYGLIHQKHLKEGTLKDYPKKISNEKILSHTTDPKAVIVYVICPANRDELCTLKIRHQNQWVQEQGKDFELNVLARSRREIGNPDTTHRLTKQGDTPQGVYRLWATLWTEDLKFGAVPRIDIDGMHPPINFQNLDTDEFTRVLPKETLLDYWVHEFPLAHALGRYLFRIHDNSVDPDFPNTYTTPQTNKTFRASQGCINTGNQMNRLLQHLHQLGILDQAQLNHQSPYGRIINADTQNAFLVVIDKDA